MAMDVLPHKSTSAKDLSIWHSALVLPQIFATPLAGGLRDYFQEIGTRNGMPALGYQVIFTICLIYFVLGLFVTKKIKGIH